MKTICIILILMTTLISCTENSKQKATVSYDYGHFVPEPEYINVNDTLYDTWDTYVKVRESINQSRK